MLPKTITYVKTYDDQTKWMYLLIKNEDLREKYTTICDKISADIKREFGSKPVYSENCLKTKILSYGNEATDFCDKEIPKPGSDYTCLEVVTIDSALKKIKTIMHKCFLKECKYIEKKQSLDILLKI